MIVLHDQLPDHAHIIYRQQVPYSASQWMLSSLESLPEAGCHFSEGSLPEALAPSQIMSAACRSVAASKSACLHCCTMSTGMSVSRLALLALFLELFLSQSQLLHELLMQPVMLFNPGKISSTSRLLFERGIAMVVVGFPATPLLSARARICISASHTREDLDWALQVCLLWHAAHTAPVFNYMQQVQSCYEMTACVAECVLSHLHEHV